MPDDLEASFGFQPLIVEVFLLVGVAPPRIDRRCEAAHDGATRGNVRARPHFMQSVAGELGELGASLGLAGFEPLGESPRAIAELIEHRARGAQAHGSQELRERRNSAAPREAARCAADQGAIARLLHEHELSQEPW